MKFLKDNGGLLAMVLRFMGIKDLKGSSSHPSAEIELTFTRYGKQHQVKFTLQEFIEDVRKHRTNKPQQAPPGYQDISDLPDG